MNNDVNDVVEKRKDGIINWFKDSYNFAFVLLILAAVITRIYYFFLVQSQPIWWDEGDYLAIAKIWALDTPLPSWWTGLTGVRPLLIPILWATFFKIGFGEMSIRFFTVLLPSLGAIFLVYLLGKDLYGRKVGLIAGTMMTFYWVFTFYSVRLLTDIPATFLGLLSFYFFWGWYIKRKKASGLYLSVLAGIMAFSTRFPLALVLVTCGVYLIFVKKFEILKDKTVWKSFALGLLLLSPYLVYFLIHRFSLFNFYFGASAVSVHQPIGLHVLPMPFQFVLSFWNIALILGIISLYSLVLYLDIIWKQKSDKFNADLFIFLWIFIHYFFYVIIFREGTDRWILIILPAFFIAAGKGLVMIYKFIKRYNKLVALIIIGIVLFGGAYQNFVYSDNLIKEKKDSYLQIKLAGEWLKENTPENTKIITESVVQNYYYSERSSEVWNPNTSLMPKDCMDKFGATINNDTCQSASESIFEKYRQENNPDYAIVSVFEPVFTPQWVYTYPQRYNLTAVQAYVDKNGQPMLIIFKF